MNKKRLIHYLEWIVDESISNIEEIGVNDAVYYSRKGEKELAETLINLIEKGYFEE